MSLWCMFHKDSTWSSIILHIIRYYMSYFTYNNIICLVLRYVEGFNLKLLAWVRPENPKLALPNPCTLFLAKRSLIVKVWPLRSIYMIDFYINHDQFTIFLFSLWRSCNWFPLQCCVVRRVQRILSSCNNGNKSISLQR